MKQLKIKYSKYFPLQGFLYMSWFGSLVMRESRKGREVDDVSMNHEGIHVCQAEDFSKNTFGFIIFYLWYVIEWFIKSICSLFTGFKIKAYRSISFEQEAYNNQRNLLYQDTRKKWAWTKYIFKVVK